MHFRINKFKQNMNRYIAYWLFGIYFIIVLLLLIPNVIIQNRTKVIELAYNLKNNEYAHMSLALMDFSPSQKLLSIQETLQLSPELRNIISNYQTTNPDVDFNVNLTADTPLLRPTTNFQFPESTHEEKFVDLTVIANPNYPGESQVTVKSVTEKGINYPSQAVLSLSGSQYWCPFDYYKVKLTYRMNTPPTLEIKDTEFIQNDNNMPFVFYDTHVTGQYIFKVTPVSNNTITINIKHPLYYQLMVFLPVLVPIGYSIFAFVQLCKNRPLSKFTIYANLGLAITLFGLSPFRDLAVPKEVTGLTLYDTFLIISFFVTVASLIRTLANQKVPNN